MTSYAEDESAQAMVRNSSPVLSGQQLPESVSGALAEGIEATQVWSRKTKDIIELWQGYLPIERDDPLDLIEAADLKITAQSLRRGLSKYLFGNSAQLQSADRDAWQGIQIHWFAIRQAIEELSDEAANYRDWMVEINRKDAQIVDPMAIRATIRQRRKDTKNILSLYADLIKNLRPVVEEILRLGYEHWPEPA